MISRNILRKGAATLAAATMAFTLAACGGGSSDASSAGLTKDALDATLIPATQQGEKLWPKLLFFQEVENLDKRLQIWNEFKLGIGS